MVFSLVIPSHETGPSDHRRFDSLRHLSHFNPSPLYRYQRDQYVSRAPLVHFWRHIGPRSYIYFKHLGYGRSIKEMKTSWHKSLQIIPCIIFMLFFHSTIFGGEALTVEKVEISPGEKLYREHCLRCHGELGIGGQGNF